MLHAASAAPSTLAGSEHGCPDPRRGGDGATRTSQPEGPGQPTLSRKAALLNLPNAATPGVQDI